MQIRIGNPSTGPTESPPEDVVVLVDSAEVALKVQHAFSAKVRAVRLAVSVSRPGAWKFRWSPAVLCESMAPSDVRGAISQWEEPPDDRIPDRFARRDHLLDEPCRGASPDPLDAIETELEHRGVEL
jgi:hypothetical protein